MHPVFFALAADTLFGYFVALFGYFVAVRELIWTGPAVVLLAAQGPARLQGRCAALPRSGDD